MHITPFGEKHFHLYTLFAISMAECLVANKILYCIVLYCINFPKFPFVIIFEIRNN